MYIICIVCRKTVVKTVNSKYIPSVDDGKVDDSLRQFPGCMGFKEVIPSGRRYFRIDVHHTGHIHDKHVVTETSPWIKYFYAFPLYFVQFVVPDDYLLLGRNMLH